MERENINQQRRSHYRSIQYRSSSVDIKQNKLSINTQKFALFEFKKPLTSNYQEGKNKRNLFKSEQNLTNLNKSFSQSLSKPKQFEPDLTQISLGNPEEETVQNFGTCSYIQSFEQLMERDSMHSYKRKKIGALSIKLQSRKNVAKIDRIRLPNIVEFNNSQFTSLDPINLPINSIKQDIQKTRNQMEECPNQLKSIRCNMQEFKKRNLQQIESFGEQFMKGANKLWAKIRQNAVYHQGFILKAKRQINELESFIPEFKKQFESTKKDQLQIQTTIFETAPFELKFNQQTYQNLQEKDIEFKQTMQSNYF